MKSVALKWITLLTYGIVFHSRLRIQINNTTVMNHCQQNEATFLRFSFQHDKWAHNLQNTLFAYFTFSCQTNVIGHFRNVGNAILIITPSD